LKTPKAESLKEKTGISGHHYGDECLL